MEDFRDDELKKWLAEEYEKEIDEMEEVLFPNGVLPDDGETEEEAKAAYKKLVDRLKADGVYEEDEPEKVKIVYLPEKKRHKAAKVKGGSGGARVCSRRIRRKHDQPG